MFCVSVSQARASGKKQQKKYSIGRHVNETKDPLRKLKQRRENDRWGGNWDLEIFLSTGNKTLRETIVLEIRIKYGKMQLWPEVTLPLSSCGWNSYIADCISKE